MQLKMKNEEDNTNLSSSNSNDSIVPNTIIAEEPYMSHDPIIPQTPHSNKGYIGLVIKLIFVFILIVVIIIFFPGIKSYVTKQPLDKYASTLSAEAIEKDLFISLSPDSNMAKALPITKPDDNIFTVNSNGSLGVIYKNGNPAGITFTSKRYTLFGFKIGEPEADIYKEGNITFPTDNNFEIVTDYASGHSVATYFVDDTTNTCIVAHINQTSHRIVAITYFNDARIATNGISSIY